MKDADLVEIEGILLGSDEVGRQLAEARVKLVDTIVAAFGKVIHPRDLNSLIAQEKSNMIVNIKLRLQVDIVKLRKVKREEGDLADRLKDVFQNELTILNELEPEFFAKVKGLTSVDAFWIGTNLQTDKLESLANSLNLDRAREKEILGIINRQLYETKIA